MRVGDSFSTNVFFSFVPGNARLQKYKVSTAVTSPFLPVGLLSSKVYTDYTPDNPNNQ